MIPSASTRRAAACLAAILLIAAGIHRAAADASFAPPEIEVPEGYVVDLVAAPPMVNHPIVAGFDDRGRLFVADTAGLNLRRDDLEEQLPGVIRILEDTTGDGRFDASSVFAEDLTFPRGALWHEGSLYVASPPYLWRLADTTGDGRADEREKIIGEFGYTGNAAGMHGPYLHPSGRLFWTQGRHGHEVRNADGEIISEARSGGVFTARLDGSDFRVHATGGMDNPFGLVFTESGDVLGNANIMLTQPRGDTLVHWIHGGVYPRRDFVDRFDEHTLTGDLLPYIANLGHQAVAGMERYRGQTFGEDAHGDLYMAMFNTHRVSRIRLGRDGSTFETREQEDFLIGRSHDFHPTDVIADADGSLLVIDTGGWFHIGCPTSQEARPEIRGAIYRVRREDAAPPQDPRGLELDWQNASPQELIARLDDDRPAVRDRALDQLGRGGQGVVEALHQALTQSGNDAHSERARTAAVWALCRVGQSEWVGGVLAEALSRDQAPAVRQAAAHALGLLGEWEMVDTVTETLARDDDPAVRRELATALGRIGGDRAVDALLHALGDTTDRMLEHSLTYALIESNAPDATAVGLGHDDPAVQRAALIALDQMPDAQLDPGRVLPMLDSPEPALRTAAVQVASRRSAWDAPVADLLSDWLDAESLSQTQRATLEALIAAHGSREPFESIITRALADAQAAPAVLRGLAAGESFRPPDAWTDALSEQLAASDAELLAAAVEAVAMLETDRFDAVVERVAADDSIPMSVRVTALQVVSGQAGLTDDAFAMLTGQLAGAAAPGDRLTAASMLGNHRLSSEQLRDLAEAVAQVGPVELPHLLRAFAGTRDEQAGRGLIAALEDSPARFAVPRQQVVTALGGLPAETRARADDLLAELQQAETGRRDRMQTLGELLEQGDAARGRELFSSGIGACVTCHRIGDEGGTIGPDLSQIGSVRSRDDLLQAIVAPSSGFARGYEPWTVTLNDGQIRFGAVTREGSDEIHLRTADGSEIAIPRADIQSMEPSPVSLMPEGLDRTMTDQQLADLIAYLNALED